jgi:hypothetical protein
MTPARFALLAAALTACTADDPIPEGTATSASVTSGAGGSASATTSASAVSGSGGSVSEGGAGGQPLTAECTHVIGYSQVRQWYEAGFEDVVEDDRWQLRWNGGAGVNMWRNPDFEGWNNPIASPCSTQSDAPDRVLLSISGPYGDDESAWAEAIADTIANIRDKHPTATTILLQPVVGGPNHMDCFFGGQLVRASWQHAHIDNAIASLVGGDVIAGASPEVGDCSHYVDELGHLTEAGKEAAAQSIGQFYLSF